MTKKSATTKGFIFTVGLILSVPALGQSRLSQLADEAETTAVAETSANKEAVAVRLALQANAARAAFMADEQDDRLDKQVGAPPGINLNTLVSHGGVASIITTAFESAGSKTIDGTLVTWRGKAVDLLKALGGQGFSELPVESKSLWGKLIGSIALQATYSTEGAANGVFSGDPKSILAAGFRVELINHRDTRVHFSARRRKMFLDAARICTPDTNLKTALDAGAQTNEWPAAVAQRTPTGTAPDRLTNVTAKSLRRELDDSTRRMLAEYGKSCEAREKLKFLQEAATGALWTFEYTYDQTNATPLSNLRLIGETPILNGIGDVVLNGAATFFRTPQTVVKANADDSPSLGSTRFRDVQAAAEVDIRLGGIGKKAGTFAASGKYQYIANDFTSDVGQPLLGPLAGSVWVGQVKLTLPMKGSGIDVPISFTVSNRTELNTEKEKRGFFGITFDPDRLLALLNP